MKHLEMGDDAQKFGLDPCPDCHGDHWVVWEDMRDEKGEGHITFKCFTEIDRGVDPRSFLPISNPCGKTLTRHFDDPRESLEYDEEG